MSPAQLATLKADILANTNTVLINGEATQIKLVPVGQDNGQSVADWYNLVAAPAFIVWRDLDMSIVLGMITYANMTPADQAREFALTALTMGPMAMGSRAGRDFGISSVLERRQPMQNIGGGEMVPVDPGIAGGPSTARATNFLDRAFSTQALRNASSKRQSGAVDPYQEALMRQRWQQHAND